MAGKKTNSKKKNTTSAPEKKNRRGVTKFERYGPVSAILLFAALLLVASFFTKDAFFVRWAAALGSGSVGYGYYLLPLALVLQVVFLFAPKPKREKPSRFAQICAIYLICIAVGLTVHLFLPRAGDMALTHIPNFTGGAAAGTASGLITGWLGELMERCVTIVLARILAILGVAVALIYACGLTVGHFVGLVCRLFMKLRAILLKKREEHAVAEAERRKAASREIPAEEPPVAEQLPLTDYGAAYTRPNIDFPLDGGKRREKAEKKSISAPVPTPVKEEPPMSEEAERLSSLLSEEPAAPIVDPDEKITREEIVEEINSIAREIGTQAAEPPQSYTYPPLDLIGNDHMNLGENAAADSRAGALKLVETLRSFGVEAHIINITHGPTITRYEMQLNSGIRLSRITNLSDDIAIAMGAPSVRIVLIPDQSAVGIEVPNREVASVYLRDVLESRDFSDSKSRVTVALGMNITGKPVVWDIAKLPHLLVAGTTGSGKSVCINSLLISLIYKATPDEVKLIMVDPKMVELGVYNGIPHLLIPVVTDPKKAAGALQWAVLEMMSRYKRFSEIGVRNIFEYNDEMARRAAAAAEEGEIAPVQKIAQTVIVIDELADLMLVAKNEVEEAICRVAQMGRAAGMHLIIATQRPSADVITGLMKANIPSRIAFSVASQLESRIILDTMGAEKLIGKGDMLFNPIGSTKPMRIQGCFVSSSQVEAVTDFVRGNADQENAYDQDVIRQIEIAAENGGKGGKTGGDAAGGEAAGDEDELLMQAIELIVNSGLASTSMLQRKLGVGHARAGRLMDQMEERGIVGPFAGSKTRDVLITKEEWQEIRMRREDMADI